MSLKFRAEQSFWDLFPEAEIGLLVFNGIDNSGADSDAAEKIRSELEEANREAVRWIPERPISKNEVISVWRDAFSRFKKKKGYKCSIESLLSRVSKGKDVGTINPLVDIYNAASLIYALPMGGDDIDAFRGDMRLAVSENGGDHFLAIGEDEDDPTLPGELCYCDDAGAVCRCWNWRGCRRTMLTSGTKNALIIIESVDPSRHDDVAAAMDRIEQKAHEYIGAETGLRKVINTDAREAVIKE